MHHYNCCPHLYPFDDTSDCYPGGDELQEICYDCYLSLPFIWRYTVYHSSGGHFDFSIYIS